MRVRLFLSACVAFVFVTGSTHGSRLLERLRNSVLPTPNHPIVLVPGDGGSQLEAKLDKPTAVHYFCERKSATFFDLWVNLELMVPYVLDCWVDNIRLVYNNRTRQTRSPAGVDIRVPGFGNTSTIEWLDPSQVAPTAYFTNIVEELLLHGYERGISIRGAPYDFRKAPNELSGYFDQLKNLIEETFAINARLPAVLVCHSMGCPNMHYFLSQMNQAWKDRHIKALVSLGGAWGGAVKALKAFASGENLGVVVINPLTVRAEQRSAPSLAFLVPDRNYWAEDEVLVSTLQRNYTIADYPQFFHDIGFPEGYEMYKDTRPYIMDLPPPGVEIHCLFGQNVSTIDAIAYRKSGFPDIQPEIIFGDGDGTVNIRSLLGCQKFSALQTQPITVKAYPGVDHMGILYNKDVINYIKSIALRD